jgi:hypothetical protein
MDPRQNKRPILWVFQQTASRERLPTKPRLGCAYLEMTLMNFDYWGAMNFFAIIIGH